MLPWPSSADAAAAPPSPPSCAYPAATRRAPALPTTGEHLPACPPACLPACRTCPARAATATTAAAATRVGQMQLQRRPRESLMPHQLREWYTGWGCRGGRAATATTAATAVTAATAAITATAATGGDRTGHACGTLSHTQSRYFARLNDAWRTEFGDEVELPTWVELLGQGVDIYALDYDAILTAMYALPTSADRACYLCVPLDPGITPAALGAGEAAALGASVSPALGTGEAAASGAGESALSGTAPAEALYTFTLDSVRATSSTVLPCPAVPSGTLSGLYLPSFSTNLVAGSTLQDAGVHQFTPAYERVTHCTCAQTGRHLATFTRQPGSGLYTLTTESPQTLLWHHRLGHPSVQRLRSMHRRVLVSCLLRVLPPLPPSPAPPCLPCVEGRQRAAPHSSSFPPTEAPLQSLHLDVWGPARVRGQGHERYFLLVVDDYTRYTTVFPLRTKGEVPDVLIPWIRATRLQLRNWFRTEFLVLRLNSDRGGEFSSNLLAAFCAEHGIHQTLTLPASPQQNRVAERHIGLVMEVARTSMIHAAAPHFLWSFAVRYAAHQLNLWPRVSLPETSPTLLWTGKVGDASRFRVWGARAFVCDTTADKLSARAVPCVFLGIVPDAPGWQFYHPTSRRVFPSQDVTFDESVPIYRLFPYHTAPLPPPPLFLTPGAPQVDPLPTPGPAPSGVSQVDPPPLTAPVEVTGDSGPAEGGPARGTASRGAELGGAEPGGAEPGGAEPGGAEPGGAEPGGAEPGGAETGGAEPGGTESGGAAPGGAEASGEQSPWDGHLGSHSAGTSPLHSRRRLPLSPQQLREWYVGRQGRAAGARGPAAGGAGAGVSATGVVSAGGSGAAEGAGAGGSGATAGAGAGGSGAAAGAGIEGSESAVARSPWSSRLRPPRGSTAGGTSTGITGAGSGVGPEGARTGGIGAAGAGGAEPGGAPAGDPGSGGAATGYTESGDPGTGGAGFGGAAAGGAGPGQAGAEGSGAAGAAGGARAAGAGGAAQPRLFFAPPSPSSQPPSDSVPRQVLSLPLSTSLPLQPGSPLPAPSPYTEQTGGLTERREPASRPVSPVRCGRPSRRVPRSRQPAVTGTHLVVRRPSSPPQRVPLPSPLASSLPTIPEPKSDRTRAAHSTVTRLLATVVTDPSFESAAASALVAEPDNLHEEIWLRRPPGFAGSFPPGTQWSLRRPVYDLRQAPREWHDTLRTTLAALGFAPSTADPSLFLRTDTLLPPFYILMYVDDLVFATADTEALTLVKSELQKRHTCTDLGELRSYLGLQITRDRARRTITLTQSHMVQQVLQRFGFTWSSPQHTPPATGHSISAPPSDESVEPSGPYPELAGCLMYLMTCTRPDLAYPLGLLARYVASGRHRKVHMDAAKRVLRYLCRTSSMGLVLGGRSAVVLTGHSDASWVDDQATQRSSQGYTFSLGSCSVSWRSTRSSSVLSSSCEAEIYATAMAAQELRWLTYLLTDLEERPCSPPVLYVDNKAAIALCQEHRTKHIALRYFLARELQQRGQLCLAHVATRANTADIFTKALPSGDHQRFCTLLGLLALLLLTDLMTPCSPPLCLWGAGRPSWVDHVDGPTVKLLLLSCLSRASGAHRFSARHAALHAARRPALPVVRPEACGGFVACRGAPCAHAPPLPSPVAAPWGGRASPPPIARRGAIGGHASPLPSPVVAPSGAARRPFSSPDLAPSGARAAPTPVARLGALGGPCALPLLQPTSLPCSPRAAPAAHVPPLQPASRPCPLLSTCNCEVAVKPLLLCFIFPSFAILTRLAVRNHLPLAERANFGQHMTAKALYDAVVAHYSSPATTVLGRLILPCLFPELSAFATIEDLVTHLRTSDARYRATFPAEFLDMNPPPMYITLYFIVTRLPDSLCAIRDHLLALDPTDLTVDLLEKHLLAAETSVVAVGAARGTPRTPFFERCSPSPIAPSYASAAAVDILGAEDVEAAFALSGKHRSSKGKGGRHGGGGSGGGGGGGSGGGGVGRGGGSGGSGGGSGFGGGGSGSGGGGGGGGGGSGSGGGRDGAVQRGGSGGGQRQHQQRWSETPTPQQLRDSAGQTCGKLHTQHRCFSHLDDAWHAEFGDEAGRPHWSELLRSGVDIFALDYDAILAAMYAFSVSAEGDCYVCVPPGPGLEAAALGANEFALPSTAPAEALHTFTLDSGASRCLCLPSRPRLPRWTGKVGDASVFRVWGSRAFVRDTSADNLSSRAIPCVFLGFPPDAPGWQFYHPTLRRVLPFQDVNFDESVPFYRLFPYRTAPLPPPPLFLAPGPPPVDPLPPQGPAPSCVSQVDPLPKTVPVEVAVDSGAARGAASGGAACGGAVSGGAEPASAEPGGAESGGAEPGGTEPEGAEPGGAECEGAESGGAKPRGTASAGGPAAAGAGGVGDAGAGGTGAGGTRAGGAGAFVLEVLVLGVLELPELVVLGALELETLELEELELELLELEALELEALALEALELEALELETLELEELELEELALEALELEVKEYIRERSDNERVSIMRMMLRQQLGRVSIEFASRDLVRIEGPLTGGAGAGDRGAGGAGTEGAGAGDTGAGGTVQRRPFFVPPPPSSLPPPDSVLCQVLSLPSSTGLPPSLLSPPPHQTQPQLQPDSPLPAPPYAEQTDTFTERREPESCPASPIHTGRRVPRPHPPHVPGTHVMALHPSSVPLRVHLPSPLASSLADGLDPKSDLVRAASPTVPRLLASVVTDPSFESTATSALVLELVDFAAACRLDYATSLVAVSESDCPPSVGGIREWSRVRIPIYALRASQCEGVSEVHWPTSDPRLILGKGYKLVVLGGYGRTDPLLNKPFNTYGLVVGILTECALGTDVLEDRQEDFECLAATVPHLVAMLLAPVGDPDAPDIPTPRSYAEAMTGPYSSQWQTTMDAEMASWKSTGTYVDAVPPSGANIVDGMWIFMVKRPPGSSPVFKDRYVARGFSQRQGVDFFQTFSPTPKRTILRVLLHVVAQRDYELHSKLSYRAACTMRSGCAAHLASLGRLLQVLQRFGFRYSSPLSTPLPTGHSLSAPPSNESVEPSGPYPELVGCLMYLMTCTRPDLAYPLSILARYVAPVRHRLEHWKAAKRVLGYLCSTSGMGLVLGGRGPVVLTGHAGASWVDDLATQRSSQGYTFSLGSGSVSWRSTRSSSVLSSSCEAEIYAGGMAVQELRWLTYLLTDLGERPRSSPVLYVDNKAMIALCQGH
ncbi:unnamed protein product [Closterium sp. NIES-53]